MTRPETCGVAGGAISLWVKMMDCVNECGIVSSYRARTGSLIYCYFETLRYDYSYTQYMSIKKPLLT